MLIIDLATVWLSIIKMRWVVGVVEVSVHVAAVPLVRANISVSKMVEYFLRSSMPHLILHPIQTME